MGDDRIFFERRLSEELYWAEVEKEPALKFLHLRWANLYRQRLRNIDRDAYRAA